jgi:hypothetical protein
MMDVAEKVRGFKGRLRAFTAGRAGDVKPYPGTWVLTRRVFINIRWDEQSNGNQRMIQFSGFGMEEHSKRERRDHESTGLRRLPGKATKTDDAEDWLNETDEHLTSMMGQWRSQGTENFS